MSEPIERESVISSVSVSESTNGNEEKSKTTTSLPTDTTIKNSEIPTAANAASAVSKIKAPSNFSGATGPPSRIGRLCHQHAPIIASPPTTPRETIMNRESVSPSSTTFTDLYQETVRQFTRSSLSPEMDRNSPSRLSMKSRTSKMSNNSQDRRDSYDLYLEATGRRRSSDHGAVLTADTEQFIIGQRVWVGGIRPGQIAYIGETHFAPGEWAGVVLDEPNGKNDGCVAGKRYFQCEPKRGIFSRLTRLTLVPLPGAFTSNMGKYSPERSMTVSPTASIRSSSMLRSPTKNGLTVGDRVIVSSGFGSRPGVLRYLGETSFASGNWCGVELDEPSGKNDGTVDGIRYFDCKAKYGVFVPIAKVSLSPSSKKTRLSRTGSRESLTSVGTMNSVATTNTSRMRMNAQRKLSTLSTKPSSVPKPQFSMQDLLREKQNHIEQLMIERELDREDAQNQALNFQKHINELNLRINHQEKLLSDERKKTEDLQFTIDEATFCGDEQSAQSQIYKEKILELEEELKQYKSGVVPTTKTPSSDVVTDERLESLNSQINKLNNQIAKYKARVSSLEDEIKQRHSNLEFLEKENATLQKELREKDESLEKFSLSESGLNNLQKEMLLLKQEYEEERQKLEADTSQKLKEKEDTLSQLMKDLKDLRETMNEREAERVVLTNECEVLKNCCEKRAAQLEEQNEDLQRISAELIMFKAENSTLDEMLKTQKLDSSGSKSTLETKIVEITKLKKEMSKLNESKAMLEANLKEHQEKIKELTATTTTLQNELKQAETKLNTKNVAVDMLHQQVTETVEQDMQKQQQLSKEVEELKIAKENAEKAQEELKTMLQQQQNESHLLKEQLMEKEVQLTKMNENLVLQEMNVASKISEVEELKVSQKQLEEIQKERQQLIDNKNEECSDLSQQSKQLSQKIEELQKEIKEKDKNLQEKLENMKILETANESSQKLVEKIQIEYDASQQRVQELELKLTQIENKLLKETEEYELLKNECTNKNTKYETLLAQNEGLEKQKEVLQNQIKEMQNAYKEKEEQVYGAQLKTLEEKFNVTMTEKLQLEANMEQLQQEVNKTLLQLKESSEHVEKTELKLSEKQKELNNLQEVAVKQDLTASALKRQLEDVETKYANLQMENSNLQQDLLNLRTSSTDTNSEIVKLSQQLSERQKMQEELLDKTNNERLLLQNEVEASKQKIDGLCKQVELLTEELKNLNEKKIIDQTNLQTQQNKIEELTLELNNLQRRLEMQTESRDGLLKILENETIKLKESEIKLQQISEEFAKQNNTSQQQLNVIEQQKLEISKLAQNLKTLEEEKQNLEKELTAKQQDFLETSKEQVEKLQLESVEKCAKITQNYENQIKTMEQNKQNLDEAVLSLQTQIKILQDEILKSQLNFKSEEEELHKQLHLAQQEKEKLRLNLEQLKLVGKQNLTDIETENVQLKQKLQDLQQAQNAQQVKLAERGEKKDQLEKELLHKVEEVNKLKEQIALNVSEMEHKQKLYEADQVKITELKQLRDTLQQSHTKMANTNAELSEALANLEQEKLETAHIFELFEMESDQNSEQLLDKLSNMKQELAETQKKLLNKETELTVAQKSLESISTEMQNSQSILKTTQAQLEETKELLKENQATQQILEADLNDNQASLEKYKELEEKLEEYKKIVEEMNAATDEKSDNIKELKKQVKLLEKELAQQLDRQKSLKTDYGALKSKYEVMDAQKSQQIVQLEKRINELQQLNVFKQTQNGAKNQTGGGDADGEDPLGQINFLNSIIVEMQTKNEALKAKVQALELLPTDFTENDAFKLISKRKPAPRVFCDICDEFDKHETEDCPLQASEDFEPPLKNIIDKERKLPEPRKYCETCEIFGHETGECGDECF